MPWPTGCDAIRSLLQIYPIDLTCFTLLCPVEPLRLYTLQEEAIMETCNDSGKKGETQRNFVAYLIDLTNATPVAEVKRAIRRFTRMQPQDENGGDCKLSANLETLVRILSPSPEQQDEEDLSTSDAGVLIGIALFVLHSNAELHCYHGKSYRVALQDYNFATQVERAACIKLGYDAINQDAWVDYARYLLFILKEHREPSYDAKDDVWMKYLMRGAQIHGMKQLKSVGFSKETRDKTSKMYCAQLKAPVSDIIPKGFIGMHLLVASTMQKTQSQYFFDRIAMRWGMRVLRYHVAPRTPFDASSDINDASCIASGLVWIKKMIIRHNNTLHAEKDYFLFKEAAFEEPEKVRPARKRDKKGAKAKGKRDCKAKKVRAYEKAYDEEEAAVDCENIPAFLLGLVSSVDELFYDSVVPSIKVDKVIELL